MRFGQEHIGALVQGRYSLVTQQRGRVLGPAYQAHDHEGGCEVFLKLFLRWPTDGDLQANLQAWMDWGRFETSRPDVPWGPCPMVVGQDPRGAFLVSPWAHGSAASDGWSSETEPTLLDMVNLLFLTLDSLHALHGAGLIHGALRPSQVLLNEQQVVLLRPGLDLFVAPTLRVDPDRWALIQAARAQTWAPEVRQRIDDPDAPFPGPPADIYGFGRVIEAALERLPRELGVPRERLRNLAQECLKPRASDRPNLEDVARKVDLAVQRHRRPRASMPPVLSSGLRSDLARLRAPGAMPTSHTNPPIPASASARRRRPRTKPQIDALPSESSSGVISGSLPVEAPSSPDPGPETDDGLPFVDEDTFDFDIDTRLDTRLGSGEPDMMPVVVTRPPPAGPSTRTGRLASDLESPPVAVSPARSQVIKREWTEAETFARYGLHEQAIERARAVLSEDPNHQPAKDLIARLAPPPNGEHGEHGEHGETGRDFAHDEGAETVLAPIEEEISADGFAVIEGSDDRTEALQPPPKPLDENVQFTVYRPRHLIANQWADLLFFAHLSERRPDAPDASPDPQAEVKRMAAGVLGDAVDQYKTGTADARAAIPRDGTLTVVPHVESVTFNPPQASFVWSEDVHLAQFRARSETPGQTHRGTMSVYYGAVLVGDVSITLRVEPEGAVVQSTPVVPAVGRRYRKIFASYSRRDLPVVQSFEVFARGLGDRYLLDLLDLRAGEVWSQRLEEMIRSADVFQLFWSKNSMVSRHVLEEVQYALSLSKDIRPVFWERPLPQDDSRNLPPPALSQFHFQFLASPHEKAPEDLRSGHLASPPTGPAAPRPQLQSPTAPQPNGPAPRAPSITDVVACAVCGQHNLRASKDCVQCGQSLATSIGVPDDLYDPFDAGETRSVDLDEPTGSRRGWLGSIRGGSNGVARRTRGDREVAAGLASSAGTPAGSVSTPAGLGPSVGVPDFARMEQSSSGGLLTAVLVAFGLALLIVSGLMLVWFNS